MGVEAVIATQVIDTTSVGRSLMTAANAAAARTAADAQVTLVSGTNLKTINSTSLLGSGDIAVGVSGAGSVDNAVLRADGTGGATLQSSAFVIADNATASPNNTVNHASLQATGGTTNVSVSIVPKGTGAFCLQVPDGTAAGGNARGANAVDLQTDRSASNQVASGAGSGLLGGSGNRASGNYSACIGGGASAATGDNATTIGSFSTASGASAFAGGTLCVASGAHSFAIGYQNTASGDRSTALNQFCNATTLYTIASGYRSLADRYGMRAQGAIDFNAGSQGQAQYARFVLAVKTTNNTPATMWLNGSSIRLAIPSGKILYADILISGIKSDGSAAACYKRKVAIKNVGGTTSLVGSVETIGTDHEDNASTDIAITADDTNDALDISVTGIASETWRWVAVVEGLEIAYGT